MAPRLFARATLAAALLLPFLPSAARAEPPGPGQCPTVQLGSGAAAAEDAGGVQLQEGLVITAEQLPALRTLVPEEVWQHREIFFYEGMKLEIGPCHRIYAPPAFYEKATRELSPKAKLDEDGNLEGYEAGLPFPPETIDASASDAGAKWAWNLELRHRGAGPVGGFRLVDFPTRIGSEETYIGSFFQIQTAQRADLPEQGYRLDVGKGLAWAAGGRFDEPFNARHLAWRQLRSLDARGDYSEIDDTFVYVPTMRKPRRAATGWVDGLFTPRYTAGGDGGGGAVPFGSDQYGPAGAINPTSALSAAQTENMRRGFVGMSLRPNAWTWSLAGTRDVIAPLNAYRPGWPENPDRSFGPSGLSPATDRWDVRHAAVIEGRALRDDDLARRITVYVDWQTQQPLYWITRRVNGLILDIGILVHRWSGDVGSYPAWPDGSPASVFDPVTAAFFSTEEGGTGWRRESWGVRSVPEPGQDLREMTTTDALVRGR